MLSAISKRGGEHKGLMSVDEALSRLDSLIYPFTEVMP